MNKTKIEWCDYTLNPVKGLCPVGCSYCYARRLYRRFGWNPKIRLDTRMWWDGLEKVRQEQTTLRELCRRIAPDLDGAALGDSRHENGEGQ